MNEIIVPRLGWSMEEGAFVAWLKQDGDVVRPGDPLFSIEGDKAIQEIESIDGGILRIAPNAPAPGASIRVGDLLGHLLSPQEAAAGATPVETPESKLPTPKDQASASVPLPRDQAEAWKAAGSSAAPVVEGRKKPAISPRARRAAVELGVDWTRVNGTGRTGRIRERDVRNAAAGQPNQRSRATRPDASPAAVFFGELLLRLGTRNHERFSQAREFEARYTGAEANAAVSLAAFGGNAGVVSAVPGHELGQACLNYLRQYGVDVEPVLRCGERLGTFYLETGAAPRASRVIYDRAGSSFSQLRAGQIDWESVLAGKQWLHWSGTAPAVGPGLPAVVAEACTVARRLGVTVSCDLNYRALLWDAAVARETMLPLMRNVDVLMGNEEHAALMLGVSENDPVAVAKELRARFGFRAVALTRREADAVAPWRCWLSNDAGVFASRDYPLASVDRIGAGDAFAGALIFGLLSNWDGDQAIEFAAAAGALKHSVPGDFNLVSREEVGALAAGDVGQRVRR